MDLQQRARPFAICPLALESEGPTQALKGHCRPLWFQHQNEWFQGQCPLLEVHEAKPPGRGPGWKPVCFLSSSIPG